MNVKSLECRSYLLTVLGNSPRNRIIDFLLGEVNYDHTLKEIALKSNIGYATIKRIWLNFLKSGLVQSTRRVGKAVFYKYNLKSKTGKALRKFYLDILVDNIEEEIIIEN